MERAVVGSIEGEFRRYKELCEKAAAQLTTEQLNLRHAATDNSIVTLMWHVSGNLESRFTEFLTSDGEKPWRDRETEFEQREAALDEALEKWERGWACLFEALRELSDNDLVRTVSIRQVPLTVNEALHRSLAHSAYHAGQIVYLSKMARGRDWTFLSIPPGGSSAYDQTPSLEKPTPHSV
jgi:uncharacterized damage-inducible protein DinB